MGASIVKPSCEDRHPADGGGQAPSPGASTPLTVEAWDPADWNLPRAAALVARPLVILDLETTGLDPVRDEIIQVAALRIDPGAPDPVLHLASSLVRPRASIPREILRLTRLDPDAVAAAPSWSTVGPALQAFVGDTAVAGHNVAFDLKFLEEAGLRLLSGLDTWDWARIAFPTRANYKLAELAADLAVPGMSHDARTDVAACYHVMAAVHRRLTQLGPATTSLLRRTVGPEADWWTWNAAPAGGETALFRPMPEPVTVPLDRHDVAMGPIRDWFLPGGALATLHPGWQSRPGQVAMADAVELTLADAGTLVAEAGTGVGKSLAYLLPAVRQAAWDGSRVVVATHTVALQDQLWQKDLPEALRALGLEDVPRALVKGRARYACLLKAEEETGGVDIAWNWEQRVAAASLILWLVDSESGERDEWVGGRVPGAQGVWEAVAADPDACLGARCRFAGCCYMRKSRRLAEGANLVVTNHALLLAHAAQGGVLPEFHHLIVDEAHHLPEVADQALGLRVDLVRSARLLTDWAKPTGMLAKSHELLGARADRVRQSLQANGALLQQAALALVELGHRLKGDPAAASSASWVETVRVIPSAAEALEESGAAAVLRDAADSLATAARQLADAVAEAESDDPGSDRRTVRWLQLGRMERVIQELAVGLQAFSERGDDWVDWWEWTAAATQVTIRRAPLNPGTLLDEKLWSAVPGGTVLTSATLTAEGRFDYLGGQLGLAHGAQVTPYPSPFATHEQSLLAVPWDFPLPNDAEHLGRVGDFAQALAMRLGGRLMVLVTSRAAVRTLADQLDAPLAAAGLNLLVQGPHGSPHQLAAHLRAHPASVLLGTSGLWEGVDVPGPALAAVILARLPFGYPGEPLEQARAEVLAQHGRSAFAARSLPQAVLKFRQGFGRLLRTESDRGAVVVLDPRILPAGAGPRGAGTRYGRAFLRSLPGPQLVLGDTPTVLEQVAAFAGAERGAPAPAGASPEHPPGGTR